MNTIAAHRPSIPPCLPHAPLPTPAQKNMSILSISPPPSTTPENPTTCITFTHPEICAPAQIFPVKSHLHIFSLTSAPDRPSSFPSPPLCPRAFALYFPFPHR